MKLLLAFGVTPARFDLMRLLYASETYSLPQSWLRAQLGVARATVSKMLRALEKLGLVERKTDEWDRRTKIVTLTYAARSLVWRVLVALVRPREIANVIDAALEQHVPRVEASEERKKVESIAVRLLSRLARRGEGVHVAFDAC